MKLRNIFILAFLLFGIHTSAQNKVVIVPQPVTLTVKDGNFDLNHLTAIIVGKNERKEAELLNYYLKKQYGFTLHLKKKQPQSSIVLKVDKKVGDEEAYEIDSKPNSITITGGGNAGLFYGIQSFLQMLPPSAVSGKDYTLQVPLAQIKDRPRFKYRGMHLDVARHFFTVNDVKNYIDYLAYHKFNNFHWHLTEDQGWRIEIKKYPLLTSVGGFRNGTIIGRYPGTGNDSIYYGGYYTQEEVKDVVRYATERHINVIPEIEMPGHASAAIAAYPYLSTVPNENTPIPPKTVWAGSKEGKQVQQTWGVFDDIFTPTEQTFDFLEDVLDEVIALFPSKYIHIGGDEAPKAFWKKSEFAQQLIKEKNLKDEHGLQSYFIHRIEEYLNSKGRQIIGWDEILEGGLAPNATVMSWRGEAGGIAAAKENHDVIMTPNSYCYFDHSQFKDEDSVTIGGFLPLEKVYSYEPLPEQLTAQQQKHILGAQANLWTEYIKNPKKLEYQLFPRISALSEVVWSPKEVKDWSRFSGELPQILARYDLWKANYSRKYEK